MPTTPFISRWLKYANTIDVQGTLKKKSSKNIQSQYSFSSCWRWEGAYKDGGTVATTQETNLKNLTLILKTTFTKTSSF